MRSASCDLSKANLTMTPSQHFRPSEWPPRLLLGTCAQWCESMITLRKKRHGPHPITVSNASRGMIEWKRWLASLISPVRQPSRSLPPVMLLPRATVISARVKERPINRYFTWEKCIPTILPIHDVVLAIPATNRAPPWEGLLCQSGMDRPL